MSQYNVQFQDGNGQLGGLRNQFINGDYRIAQRGTDITSTVAFYGLDRWFVSAPSGGGGTDFRATQAGSALSAVGFDHGLRIRGADARGANQPIELTANGKAGRFVIGSTWTCSVYCNKNMTGISFQPQFSDNGDNTDGAVNASAATTWALVPGSTSDANGFSRYFATITINAAPATSNKCLKVGLSYDASFSNDRVYCGAQFEPGPIVTPFERRPIGLELSLCQRYFFKYPGPPNSDFTGTTNIGLGGGQNTTTGLFNSMALLPQPLRADPTVTFTGSPELSEQVYNAPVGIATSMTFGKLGLSVTASPAPFTQAGKSCNLRLKNGASISFDAEL